MDTLAKKGHFMRRASFGCNFAELNSSTSNGELLNKWLREPPVINLPSLGAIEKGSERRNQTLNFSNWLVNQSISATNPLHEKKQIFGEITLLYQLKKLRFRNCSSTMKCDCAKML